MELKELDTSSPDNTSSQSPKNLGPVNKKRKLKSLEDEDNGISEEEDEDSVVNGKIPPKKKKKGKSKEKAKKRPNTSRPFVNLNLRTYFKHNKKLDCRIKMSDIQRFMLFCIMKKTTGENPGWFNVAHRKKIQKAVVILLRSVGEKDFAEHVSCFPFILNEFSSSVVPTNAAGTDFSFQHPHETLLSVPLSKTQIKKRRRSLQEKLKANDNEKSSGEPVDKSVFLLTEKQLMSNKYPSGCYHKLDNKEGFLPCVTHATASDDNSKEQPVFAIDCEMCITSKGQELTRISILDESMNLLYDTLVKPDRPILDYKTEYSGITAESLEGVTVTLQDVQKQVQALLPHGAILAGHSLECDLYALQMYHDKVIDTAILYQDKRGGYFKPSLKFLADFYLQKKIQNGTDGHCSIEDAKTCLELVKLKFQGGPNFGLIGRETEGLLKKIASEKKICSMIDYPYIAGAGQSGGHHVVPCTSDSDIVSNAINHIKSSHFTWIHLHGAQQFYDGMKAKAIDEGKKDVIRNVYNMSGDAVSDIQARAASARIQDFCVLAAFQSYSKKKDKDEVFKELDSRVREIYQEIPEDCLTLVIMGCGDVSQVIRLQKDPEPRTEELRKAVKEAKKGLCFMKITQA